MFLKMKGDAWCRSILLYSLVQSITKNRYLTEFLALFFVENKSNGSVQELSIKARVMRLHVNSDEWYFVASFASIDVFIYLQTIHYSLIIGL